MDAAPEPRSLYIALPTYGGIEPAFLMSMLQLEHVLSREGIPHRYAPLIGESHITRGRNKLAHRFMQSAETDFLFLDCDLQFDPQTILRLLRSGHDVVGAPYPVKAHPTRLVCTVTDEARARAPGQDGFVEAYDVPTGCLLVRRRVFDRLREIVHTYRDDLEVDPAKREIVSLYFDDGIEDGSRPDSRWLSEDYWFVRMAQLAGFTTWLDARARLRHFGRIGYECPSLEEQWATEAKRAAMDAADAIELPDPFGPDCTDCQAATGGVCREHQEPECTCYELTGGHMPGCPGAHRAAAAQ
jgi:hypothetical protein